MKLKLLAAVAALVAGAPAFAAIAPGSTGNGELFFVAADSTAKISFAFDLGMRMDDVLACENNTGGICKQNTFAIASNANWTTFTGLTTAANVRWAVMALDSSGGLVKDAHKLITTVRTTDTSKIGNLTNAQLSNGIGATQGGQWFGTVNATGTHTPQNDYTVNGSSVNFDNVGSGLGYFGKAASLGPTLNGNSPFNVTNVVGAGDMPLYLLSRSGSANGSFVTVNQLNYKAVPKAYFANFDGTNLVVAIPEPSTYALMLGGLLAVGALARRRRG